MRRRSAICYFEAEYGLTPFIAKGEAVQKWHTAYDWNCLQHLKVQINSAITKALTSVNDKDLWTELTSPTSDAPNEGHSRHPTHPVPSIRWCMCR